MHTYITYVADRTATREVEALFDFYGLGRLINAGELTYEVARDDLANAFKVRGLAASTAKVYVSQGYALAQLFDTFADVEEFADDDCGGSRSLKRIYDATRVKADKPAAVVEVAPVTVDDDVKLVDVILANLAHLTDRR